MTWDRILGLTLIAAFSCTAQSEKLAVSDGPGEVEVRAQCVLSARNLFVRPTPVGQDLEVIPLETALIDPACPKVRSYYDIRRAYIQGADLSPDQISRALKVVSDDEVFCSQFPNAKRCILANTPPKAGTAPCALSSRGLFVHWPPKDNTLDVIPLQEALKNPDCPNARDYFETQRAYIENSGLDSHEMYMKLQRINLDEIRCGRFPKSESCKEFKN